MDKKQFYTAPSRTTKYESMLLKSYYNSNLPELELINTKHNTVFKSCKIYDDTIYVGSTCEELEMRWSWQ